MDELDKLKSHWKKQEAFPEVSENAIYAMLHKRSSSNVKWILIISLIEFAFWGLGSLLSWAAGNKEYNPPKFLVVMDYVNYFVLAAFIILFYINYRRISVEKSINDLLQNIISIRRVVKFYMVYNVCIISFSLICGLLIYKDDLGSEDYDAKVIAVGIVAIILIVLVVILLYNVLYGRLLRKLTKNYAELKKIKNL